jgi:hypothetical protein
MRKLMAISALVCAMSAVPASVLAAQPNNPDCWGAATADFARSAPGALGEHSSNPPDVDLGLGRPGRAGLGNVAQILTGTHQPGDLAAALGFTCP